MIKYYNSMVVFEEIPNEITLAINITNCPCKCVGCHSKFLWDDVGNELTTDELSKLLDRNYGISCVCFMGGDSNPKEVNALAKFIKSNPRYYGIKVGWYSGRDSLSNDISVYLFDYIKIGHYDSKLGGLRSKRTNQKMYKVDNGHLDDITEIFHSGRKAF
jgi:anaerobic ribonucleoside-triphosphate reductase activating protein